MRPKCLIVALAVTTICAACVADEASRTAPEFPRPLETTDSPTSPAAATQEEAGSPVPIEVTVVASNLEAPWGVAFTPDGRAFVAERDTGRVLELVEGEAVEVQRLDVNASGEAGLLGLAASPEWETDGLLYAYFTSPQGDNRIVRFRLGEAPEPILTGIPAASIHDGGRLAFGPDGMLYATTGDATRAQQAQDPTTLNGKILRMTPDGQPAPGNPFRSSVVYSYGHRNVQGLAWSADGTLYATEFGPGEHDEVNRIRAGGNYGWPVVTGDADREGFIDPEAVASPAQASWSGAAILVEGAIPQWEGNLFAAALRGQRLYRFVLGPDGGVAEVEELLVGEIGRLRSVAQAPDGSLWLLTNNRDGRGRPGENDDRVLRIGPS